MRHAPTEPLRHAARGPLAVAVAAMAVLWPAMAAGADVYTPEIGGRGGAAFADRCAPGDVLVGFEFRAGKAIDSVRAMCRTASLDPESADRVDLLNKFGGNQGVRGRQRCLRQAAITALNVSVDKHGALHRFYAICTGLDGRPGLRNLDIHGEGGETRYSDISVCPRGFAVGITGASKGLVLRLGLICADVVVEVLPKPAPIPQKPQPKPEPPAMKIDRQAGDMVIDHQAGDGKN